MQAKRFIPELTRFVMREALPVRTALPARGGFFYDTLLPMPDRIGNASQRPIRFSFACPLCRGPLQRSATATYTCPRDDQHYSCVDGIWRFLPPSLTAEYRPFIAVYETVRRAEGWEHADPAYYQALPFTYGRQRFQEVWRIRVGSYRKLMAAVVNPLAARLGRTLQVLDLGAGTGWLSYRLAQAGHESAAVDVVTNDWDGLGAWKKFAPHPLFVPVQAAFDHAPFPDGEADLVIYNGAIHYARDYSTTLREALRLLRPDGQVVIMDSPFYRSDRSGEQMVREKEVEFAQAYGVDIRSLPAENYLTSDRLAELGEQLGIRWHLIRPFRGLRWTIGWWRHRLRGRREPARFPLIVGQPDAG